MFEEQLSVINNYITTCQQAAALEPRFQEGVLRMLSAIEARFIKDNTVVEVVAEPKTTQRGKLDLFGMPAIDPDVDVEFTETMEDEGDNCSRVLEQRLMDLKDTV